MEHLQQELDRLMGTLLDADQIRSRLKAFVSVYPFNEYEFIISHLLAKDALSLDQYLELRDNYRKRNQNRHLFTLSPTPFGITWIRNHLRELAPELETASTGEYDFRLDREIRVEVKASRAVDRNSRQTLVEKALTSSSARPFLMNFQQTKTVDFDVMIWIGVWLDLIRYWVLSATEVGTHRRYSDRQHRRNVGEGQLHVTNKNIVEFDSFQIQPNKLADAIREAYKRQQTAKKPG